MPYTVSFAAIDQQLQSQVEQGSLEPWEAEDLFQQLTSELDIDPYEGQWEPDAADLEAMGFQVA